MGLLESLVLSSMALNLLLPEDVVVEILSRLPVKSLLRFKCVCTYWRSLISSPFFVSLHLNRSLSNLSRHSILVLHRCGIQFSPLDTVTVSPIQNFNVRIDDAKCFGHKLMFVGSINGVLCISDRSGNQIWLWNPSTRQYRKLPPHINRGSRYFSLGFGCDPIANDYKVVMIGCRYNRDGEGTTSVEVWSVKSECWREIEVDCYFYPWFRACHETVEGFAHWIVLEGNNMANALLRKYLVVSFDMRTEKLQLIPVPLSVATCTCDILACNWKENVALVSRTINQHGNKVCQLWTIENSGLGEESWSMKFESLLDDRFCGTMQRAVKGKVLMTKDRKAIFYDLGTRTFQKLDTHKSQLGGSAAHYYVESLVSVRGFNPLGEGAKEDGTTRKI